MNHLRQPLRTTALILVVSSLCLPAHGQPQEYALRGTLVTPTEVIANGTILVSGEKIQAVGKDISLPAEVKIVETHGFIYPGLIDLHDHITWNFLPRWKPGRKFANRYEWQQIPEYGIALNTPHAQIFSEGLACDANQYAEVKALVGGATAVVGSLAGDKCIEGLVRNLDFYSGLYPPGMAEKLRNEVFPLELPTVDVVNILKAFDDGQLTALLVHLAEGRPSDASSNREFRMLRARGLIRPGVSIIHGTALHQTDFQEMAKNNVGLIWSPRSNLELYGDTTDVRTAKQSGVKIALAPDWSPSGSDGILQELKYAAAWNAGQYPKIFTDAELVQMVTLDAAQLAKLDDKIGTLQSGRFADLLVIRSDEMDAYRALLHADPLNVRLVTVGGSPAYGDAEMMRDLAPESQLQSLQLCHTARFVDLETEKALQGTAPKTWKQTVDALTHALDEWGLTAPQITPCLGEAQ
jgi:5-methylthioadenosine/S-adenosylhomocysteine deaminase